MDEKKRRDKEFDRIVHGALADMAIVICSADEYRAGLRFMIERMQDRLHASEERDRVKWKR